MKDAANSTNRPRFFTGKLLITKVFWFSGGEGVAYSSEVLMLTIAGGILIALAVVVVMMLALPAFYVVRKVLKTEITTESAAIPERR